MAPWTQPVRLHAGGLRRRYPHVMPVRVGFLGCGFIARYHAMQLALATEPNEIVASYDPDRDRARQFAATNGGEPLGSVEEVLALSDAVFVCTWTAAHRRAVEAVAAAGLPVFCEKPLGVDLADATAVAEAASRAPLNMVGLVLRSSPALLAVRELLADPDAGELMAIVFRDDQYIPTQGMYDSDWRGDRDRAGSGTLLEHSIHDVDLLEWLVGTIDAVSAHHSFLHGLEGIEDVVSVLGRFTSGASLTLSSIWHDIFDRPSQRRIELFCRHRLITLEGDVFGPVHLHSDSESLSLADQVLCDWLVDRGVHLCSAEQEFLAAVAARLAGGAVPTLRPDVNDALRAHVVVDAMYRSAVAGGEMVGVPPGLPEETTPGGAR